MGMVEAEVECGVTHNGGNQLVAEVVHEHAQRRATEKHAGDEYKVTPSISEPFTRGSAYENILFARDVRCIVQVRNISTTDQSCVKDQRTHRKWFCCHSSSE